MQGNDMSLEARWKDSYAQQRASIAIYDLIDADNVRARQITRAVDSEDFELAKTLSKEKESPLIVINRSHGSLIFSSGSKKCKNAICSVKLLDFCSWLTR